MKLVSPKLAFTKSNNAYWHWCPGCKELHQIVARPSKQPNGASWDFNLDLEKPTFSPSIKVSGGRTGGVLCHYFLKQGILDFCGDSAHSLKGQKVPLPDIPAEEQAFYIDEVGY